MKILFHDNYLCERGTTVALFDYAYYNQEILNNESIITFNGNNTLNNEHIIDKFKKYFKLVSYDGTKNKQTQLNTISEENKINFFYGIKAGENDGIYPTNIKIGTHCVFNMRQPHGNVYAAISVYMSNKYGGNFPVVNHIVTNKENIIEDLRAELGIPKTDFIFGRYGGYDTFSLSFVKDTIKEIINSRKDMWFIFLNTEKFIDHPRVLFLPLNICTKYKTKFINTCDAMLHARQDGETFGLACAEFSIKNKPIITWYPDIVPEVYDTSHIFILKEKGIYYKNNQDLTHILLNIKKTDISNKNWDAYGEVYSPTNVINEFKTVFLG